MKTLWIRIVDADFHPLKEASVRAMDEEQRAIKLQFEEECWVAEHIHGQRVTIEVAAKGFEAETHGVILRDKVTQTVIGLRRPGQVSYSYGDNRLAFSPLDNALLLRVRGTKAAETFSKITSAARAGTATGKPAAVEPFRNPATQR